MSIFKAMDYLIENTDEKSWERVIKSFNRLNRSFYVKWKIIIEDPELRKYLFDFLNGDELDSAFKLYYSRPYISRILAMYGFSYINTLTQSKSSIYQSQDRLRELGRKALKRRNIPV